MLFRQTQHEITYELPDYDRLIREHAVGVFKPDAAYAGVASIPRREANLRLVLESLYSQIEHFFVYLNEYDHLPEWLDDSKFTVFRSQDYQDLNATGKVFFAQAVDNGYYFTLDDDFIYPGNYVAKSIETMRRYDDRVSTCVHGSIFPPNPEYYYLRSAIYQYQGQLERDRFVCLPGTGSFAAKVGSIDLSIEQFLPQVMVDLTCAIICKQSGVPLVAMARPSLWLQNIDREGLYQQFTQSKTHHTYYASEYGPWGFDQYAPAITEIADALKAAGRDILDDPLADHDAFVAVRNGCIPNNWTDTPHHYARVAEYMRVERHGFRV